MIFIGYTTDDDEEKEDSQDIVSRGDKTKLEATNPDKGQLGT